MSMERRRREAEAGAIPKSRSKISLLRSAEAKRRWKTFLLLTVERKSQEEEEVGDRKKKWSGGRLCVSAELSVTV